jgi:phosphatidylglycerophosphate synthase
MQRTVNPINADPSFVVDLLTTLQKERFSPLGWWRFIGRSWERSCATANAHPTLKRSWLYTTLLIGMLAVTIIATSLFFEGTNVALQFLPGFVFCIVWQQSDLFWHLGLNRHAQTGEILPKVGAANTLTLLRGLSASYLLGRLIGGLTTPSWLALLVFLCGGVVTDILDGQVARATKTQSKLGQIADGEADFCLYLAITLILIQNSPLPLWLGIVMLLRFAIPLLAALGSYFLFAHPVRFGSTVWGKYAGLAQCLYFLVLLAPPQVVFVKNVVNLPLLVVTLVLLVVAPVAQIVENVKRP